MIARALIGCASLLACGGSGGVEPRSFGETRTVVTSARPPMTDAEAAAAASPGTLAARRIHERVADQMAAVRQRCGSIERKIDYEATLHLEIGASGRVEIARARGNHPIVDACVSDVASTWQFPASGGRTIADVPIALLRVD